MGDILSSEKSVSEDIFRESFGNRLKSLMKALGKTQVEFADELGVSQSRLSEVANDKGGHRAIWIAAIACIFRVNRAWLKSAEGPMRAVPKPAATESEVVESLYHRIEQLAAENTRLRKNHKLAKWRVINEEVTR